MPLSQLLNRPVSIIRRSESDDFDSTWTESVVHTVGELQQRQRAERDDVVGIADWLLVLPPGTSVDTNDVVYVAGGRYEVTGPPWRARNPRTQTESHIEASLRYTGEEAA